MGHGQRAGWAAGQVGLALFAVDRVATAQFLGADAAEKGQQRSARRTSIVLTRRAPCLRVRAALKARAPCANPPLLRGCYVRSCKAAATNTFSCVSSDDASTYSFAPWALPPDGP